jgi:hypothetical protein
MSDQFVPLALPSGSPKDAPFSPFNVKVLPQPPAVAAPAFEALMAASPDPSRSPETCSKPIITLQRKGEMVSEIRIQCGCGKVIELTCLH